MLNKLIDLLARSLSILMVLALGVMVVLVFTNVVLRYGFNSGLTVSEELSRWLFVWMTFLGAFVGLRDHTHLGTDTLIARLPISGKRVCFAIAHAVMLYMSWLMLQGSWIQLQINLDATSPVMEVSMGWFFGAGVLFSILAMLVLVNELVKLFTNQLQEADLIGVKESDEMPHGGPHQ